jgi:hypothetical protein
MLVCPYSLIPLAAMNRIHTRFEPGQLPDVRDQFAGLVKHPGLRALSPRPVSREPQFARP